MARRMRLPWWLQGGLTIIFLVYLVFEHSTSPNTSFLQPVTPAPVPQTPPVPEDTESRTWVTVLRVVDGDTFVVESASSSATVRIVGIDTPETVDPRRPVECFGREASEQLKLLLLHTKVQLVSDPTQADRDRYGRLLRFVFLPDGQDVGQLLLQDGYAQSVQYGSQPHEFTQQYQAAEEEAQMHGRGLWSPDACSSEHSH